MNLLEVLTARGGAETPKMATSSQEDANTGEFMLTFEEELGHLCTFVAHSPETATTGPGTLQERLLGETVTPGVSAPHLSDGLTDTADRSVIPDVGAVASEGDVAPKTAAGLMSEIVQTGTSQTDNAAGQINHPTVGPPLMTGPTLAGEQPASADHSVSLAEKLDTKTSQQDASLPLTAAPGAVPLSLAVGDAAAAPRVASQHQSTSDDAAAATQRNPVLNQAQTLAAQGGIARPSAEMASQPVDGLPADGRARDRSTSEGSQINRQEIEPVGDRILRNQIPTSGSFAAYERAAMPQVTTATFGDHISAALQARDQQDSIPMREAALIGAGASAPTASAAHTGLSTHAPAPVQQVLNQISVIEDKASAGVLEVRLDPEDLGKVRLSFVTRDTGLVVSVFAERPETLELLRRNSDELQLGLNDMNFEDADLEFSASQGESDADREDELEAGAETRLSEAVVSKHVIAAVADDRLDIRL